CAPGTVRGGDFAAVLERADSSIHGPVGIALTSDAMPGSFAAFGLARHGKGDQKYFSSINFDDPKMLLSATTVFAGVPVGSTPSLSENNYVPKFSLANFSDKNLNVRINYSRTSGTTPSDQEIAALSVAAKQSKTLTLDGIQGDPELTNSFTLSCDGAPGDLMSKLVAVA